MDIRFILFIVSFFVMFDLSIQDWKFYEKNDLESNQPLKPVNKHLATDARYSISDLSNKILDTRYSSSFSSHAYDFVCPSKVCEHQLLITNFTYSHFMIGTSHSESFNLLVHKVCDLIHKCFDKSKIIIIVHLKELTNDNKANLIIQNNFNKMTAFLDDLNINYKIYNGTFTAQKKMIEYLQIFGDKNNRDEFIYHSGINIYIIYSNVYY